MAIWLWIGFIIFIIFMLALDLGVFNRKDHVIGIREAMQWTAFWIALALLFNVGVYFLYKFNVMEIGGGGVHELSGREAAIQFFTGYIIEKSLSMDNIFVIALIFSYFRVPGKYQHRVLFWGILGAIIMRGIMILAGAALIARFSWMIYVFGGLLIVTAAKMLISKEVEIEPEKNLLVRLVRRFYPVSSDFQEHNFFTRVNGGKRAVTPLFIALLVVESSDVIFAIDSIPAIFAVTRDPFLVFTSNIFAILGLRSMYFALAAMIEKFKHLKTSIIVVLVYVGVKMIMNHHFPIPAMVSLAIIGSILLAGFLISLYQNYQQNGRQRHPLPTPRNGNGQLQAPAHASIPVHPAGEENSNNGRPAPAEKESLHKDKTTTMIP